MKNLVIMFATMMAFMMLLLISCKPLNPAMRYAKEHEDKEFKSWSHVEKEAKKEKRWRKRQARKMGQL